MRKFFQKLRRDCRGAVTVFVTLLLIPAVLVSGTGVDLARLYTARSIVHDANQLAANSALASYDALLQDLYGLYGIMKDDPEFATMVDEYIQVAVFGEDWTDRGQGTFQLFYGSDLIPGEITPAEGKNLANQEVLRRQIEEYAKFRAPVIIVQEILDKLDSFEKVQEDAAVIKEKMEIEDRIEEIDELYRRIYKSIQLLNKTENYEKSAMESVNWYIEALEEEIDYLYTTRDGFTQAMLSNGVNKEDIAADYETQYKGHIQNIQTLIKGGIFFNGWIPGGVNPETGTYESGYWSEERYQTGLNSVISDRTEALGKVLQNTDGEIDNSFQEFCDLCQKADEQREKLEQMVDDLEDRLNSGACSEGLKDGLTKPPENDPDGPSIIERYRDVLSYDVSAMADAMAGKDVPQIQATIERLNSVGYGDPNVNIFYSRDYLKNLTPGVLPITVTIENQSRGPDNQVEDKLALLDSVIPERYTVPGTFEPFESNAFKSTKNPEFYARLQEFYSYSGSGSGSSDEDDKKKNILSALESILGQIQKQFEGFLEFDPEGALRYENGSDDSGGVSTDFGMAGDWGSEDGAKDQVKEALNDNLLSNLGSAATSAADRILLLTYDSEMFSCYSTNKGGGEDAPVEESMSGIPLGVDVNYYYQSELEYLYNGDLTSAENNLKSVTGMIFLVRFVFNYVASFSVSSVVNAVSTVESTLAWTGPFAVVVGELVRLAMALGESVIDVSRLKDGDNVALLKMSGNWRFSLSGQLNAITSGGEASLSDGAFSAEGAQGNEGLTLGYKDYLRLFLLLKGEDTLAQRTAKLIELNVTNKRENFGGLGSRKEREQAMSSAQLFRMDNAITDFSITTSVELKMLFLSMPFAQQGVNGVVPPGTLPVSVTDYRGY